MLLKEFYQENDNNEIKQLDLSSKLVISHVSLLLWTKCELLHQVLPMPGVDRTCWMRRHALNCCALSLPSTTMCMTYCKNTATC